MGLNMFEGVLELIENIHTYRRTHQRVESQMSPRTHTSDVNLDRPAFNL